MNYEVSRRKRRHLSELWSSSHTLLPWEWAQSLPQANLKQIFYDLNMPKDILPERRAKNAIIHEPQKGLFPKKSCLKRSSGSQDSSVSVHESFELSEEQRSNAATVGALLEGSDFNDGLAKLIREDADLPKDRTSMRKPTEPLEPDSAQLEENNRPYALLKRKSDEMHDMEDKENSKKSKTKRLSKDEIRHIVRQKVREANRAIALEELAARTSLEHRKGDKS